MSEIERFHKGVYAVPRLGDNTVLIKVPEEDKGKVEGLLGRKMSPISLDQSGLITGMVEDGESPEVAAARELSEEYSIYKAPTEFTNGLPSVEVAQVRNEQLILFHVLGHRFDFSHEEIDRLKEYAPTTVISDSFLREFLLEEHKVRPAVHGILGVLADWLDKGHKI